MARNKLHEAVLHAAELSKRFPVTVHVAEVRIVGTPRVIGYALFVSCVPAASEDYLHKYTDLGSFRDGLKDG